MRLYSTLTRTKEELPPAPGPVRMYVCGSTVYQRIHVGNSRPFVLAMWIRSWLKRTGYEVTLVHNITDVDDKIYVEAARLEASSRDLAEWATTWFHEDTDALGLGRPDVEPRASETMPEIVALIEQLVERGLAYAVEGDVYFRVSRYPGYGELSGVRAEEMMSQEPNPRKEDPRDFALWKAHKEGEDFAWDSPWGPGRPGWHIECSAMAEKYLGPEFEIHGGGAELRFPHHENERAQSCGLGHPFARIWMHNGLLELDEEKMSKSLGNVVTLQDALARWGREALLVFHLTGHWRKPVDFDDEALERAEAQAESFRNVFRGPSQAAPAGAWERFAAALEDDFNTPEALAVMHEWHDHELLERALDVFGLASLAEQREAPAEVVELAQARQGARERRDFEQADALRGRIGALGWEVRDVADGFQLVPR